MSLELKDRVPTRPNRKLITPEGGGTPYFATIVHADEPVEVGTPINKSTLNNILTEANAFTISRTGINAKELRPWSNTPNEALINEVPVGVTHITFIAISDFKQSDSYFLLYSNAASTAERIKLTITDLTGEPLDDGVWKTGSPVSLIIQGDKAFFKGGGVGTNDTLPSLPIFSLSPKSSSIIINFTELSDVDYPYLMDYVFVYKTNGYPMGYKDGTPVIIPKEQSGKERSFEISGLISGETYYFRVFTRNFKKQVQTMIIEAFKKIKIGYEEPYLLEPLSIPRVYSTSSPLANGVIVSGGASSTGYIDTSDYYDNNKIHSTLTPLSEARADLTSSPLANGVIVSGGGGKIGIIFNTSDYYDNNKVRSTLTPLSEARYKLTSSPLSNGIGVFGGTGVTLPSTTSDYYDNNKIHSTLTPLSEARGLGTSSPLANGVVVSGGGIDENNTTCFDTSDYYDNNKVRSTLTPLSEARASLTSSSLDSGVIVSGGQKDKIALNIVDYYDNNKVRSTLTPLSVPMSHATSTILANGVIVFNGIKESPVVNFYNKNKVRTVLQSLSVGTYAPTSSPLADGAILFGENSVEFYPEGSTIPQT